MPELIRKLLELRGVKTEEEVRRFLNPDFRDFARPEELPGVVEAADAILAALVAGKELVVFGDYDCDGVCATAILVMALEALKAKVSPFLPDRLTEGYGLSDAALRRCLKENPGIGMVITVDNGINSVNQIAELAKRGIDTVVTDHHLPSHRADSGELDLPAAKAIVDPKVKSPEKLENLCGAGVAFLLARRLTEEATRRGLYDGAKIAGPMVVLAGLATITDIMKLGEQNRILVHEALARFRQWAPMGLLELHDRVARAGSERMTSKDFGFMLGPRINAAGRMASGMEALELILSADREIAREAARNVDMRSNERKAVEAAMTEEAVKQIVWEDAANMVSAPAQVLYLPDGHPGVAGIVAARIMEMLGDKVPVCVLAGSHGSARSPGNINIRDAFVACSDVLERFGGHAAAGGFSVKEGKVDEFRRRLCDWCRDYNARNPPAATDDEKNVIDVSPEELTVELGEWLPRLEPFGEGNPEPSFRMRNVYFGEVKPIGADGRHLSVSLRRSGLRGVSWGNGELVEKLRAESAQPHDVVFSLALSDYGERHVELRITKFSLSAPAAEPIHIKVNLKEEAIK